ncbi:efflux RND transporter periplasmic adaptor subunit [Telmatocola sphagniphila]|uniref:Efflux RND transporter periplasmic adaptor subunit n=1 Tax=Telmatocola sphagniphila TaxID=1123043 RepID=A0A8E6B856_9BACT|nr:efflux RND transporter periplasmic adaptor subunit [Telmatocola sphagniphila]QVL33900.1 efflux RND transporter periplasmic adaptor subunit [Telmatocola sphagniphila]
MVSYPVEREVTDYTDFTGVLSAVDSVEVRARVYGFLDKVNFKEGALVKKGDVLYEIDPRTYQAAVNQAKAKVVTDEAQERYARADYERYQTLGKTGAVSKEDLEKALSTRDIAISTVIADKADLASKQLDLDFTKVIAPIDGRIGRILVTVGNLVQSGQTGGTLLTTIVSVDPVYCNFDIDEHTLLRVQQLIREGKVKSARNSERPVMLGLSNEKGFPHSGVINFVDNQLNSKTGTLRLRGVFSNPDNSLLPGLFARIRVPIGEPHKAILVSDQAIDTDQGQKILYLIDDKDTVFTRSVTPGAVHQGMRVIENGAIKAGERIIVAGLQQVKVDTVVEPKLIPMPVAGSAFSDVDPSKLVNPKK